MERNKYLINGIINELEQHFIERKTINWEHYYISEDNKLYKIGNEIINSLIIPIQNLDSKFQKIIESDEDTKRKFIQSIYSMDDIDEFNDLEFASFLFYMLNDE